MSLGIYIHIPLCKQRCKYCDFISYTETDLENKYIEALLNNIDLLTEKFKLINRSVDTIYFGGGTPSLLSPKSFDQIFNHLNKTFNVHAKCEITVEGNPESTSDKKLSAFKKLGVNRLSLGIQSLNDKILKNIGRLHTKKQALRALSLAHKYFTNFSADLIFGLPSHTLENYSEDLIELGNMQVPHISAYLLSLTNNRHWKPKNLPKDSLLPDFFKTTKAILENFKIKQYEISNYAKTHHESQHNLKYWTDKEYIGFGCAAHSYLKHPNPIRFANELELRSFIKNSRKTSLKFSLLENLSEKDLEFDFITCRLRLTKGLKFSDYTSTFLQDFYSKWALVLKKHETLKNLTLSKKGVAFTPQGILFSDKIFSDFFR